MNGPAFKSIMKQRIENRFLHSEYKRIYFSDIASEFARLEKKALEMAEMSKSKDFTRGCHINEVLYVFYLYE